MVKLFRHLPANLSSSLRLIPIALLMMHVKGLGQDDKRRTIDITSTFKPVWLPAEKIRFNASPLLNTGERPRLEYNLPVQNLVFRFVPTSLRPLAFADSVIPPENKAYVKAGAGNFSTAFLQAAANFGNGSTTTGTTDGYFNTSKGPLPFQTFTLFGARAKVLHQLSENHLLQVRGGFAGHHTNRYGLGADTIGVKGDSLRLQYRDVHMGATLGNQQANEAGLYYKASLDGHFFGDNLKGNETALHYDIPLEKELSNHAAVIVGLAGVMSRVNTPNANFGNNLTLLKAGARLRLTDDVTIKAAVIPSWNNKNFALLPDVEVDMYLNEKDLVVQTGLRGGYQENTWRNLVAFNPWVEQPGFLTHSRNTELFAAVKAVVDEHISFRIKGSYQRRLNVPLFVNDAQSGKTFELLWEPGMNISGATGEFNWQLGDEFLWYSQLTLQSFSGLKESPRAYGLLPLEFTSSLRAKVLEKLAVKADLYNFSATWFRNKQGNAERGQRGLDLNFGADFELVRQASLWLQFNNVFNRAYQRWNQYPVLGFQVLGGVLIRF